MATPQFVRVVSIHKEFDLRVIHKPRKKFTALLGEGEGVLLFNKRKNKMRIYCYNGVVINDYADKDVEYDVDLAIEHMRGMGLKIRLPDTIEQQTTKAA
jgi:hypothetical protein